MKPKKNKLMKIRAGIIGGAGYTGGELARLLLNHPGVEMGFIHSRSNAGKFISDIHQDLLGETDLRFSEDIADNIEVLFLCVGHGEARKFLAANKISEKIRVIDLSQDFRLRSTSAIGERNFVYGLPELNKEKIKTASNIANPGCFATAIQLGLLPLAKMGLLKEAFITGITGSTGAGQGLSHTSHFSWRANNIQAYKTLTHQHLGEIGESIEQLQQPGKDVVLNFIPWRGDFTRGIFTSTQLDSDLDQEKAGKLYRDFYADAPFTQLSVEPISLKQVVNTNKCVIQLEKVGNKLVIHTAIDNLLKGASGQAVQNMNLVFGFEETEGLKLKATGF
jgi:N-acetyl-gamma-glutamyl-phosphate reductase